MKTLQKYYKYAYIRDTILNSLYFAYCFAYLTEKSENRVRFRGLHARLTKTDATISEHF